MVCYGLQGDICGGAGCVELTDARIKTRWIGFLVETLCLGIAKNSNAEY